MVMAVSGFTMLGLSEKMDRYVRHLKMGPERPYFLYMGGVCGHVLGVGAHGFWARALMTSCHFTQNSILLLISPFFPPGNKKSFYCASRKNSHSINYFQYIIWETYGPRQFFPNLNIDLGMILRLKILARCQFA